MKKYGQVLGYSKSLFPKHDFNMLILQCQGCIKKRDRSMNSKIMERLQKGAIQQVRSREIYKQFILSG